MFDPATGRVTKRVAFASTGDVDRAVAASRDAFGLWRVSSLTERTKVLFRFRELLHERTEELAGLITSEHGKALSDARGEIARALEVVEFACGVPQLLKGGYSEGVSTRLDVYSLRQPLGVVVIISPFNFPAMVPCWFFPIAIATGNAVVVKPSEKDPSAANWLARLWAEAGLPAGVYNVVHGDKVAVDRLLEHDEVQAVSFVGSTPIARYVYEHATRAGKRVQALGGAKNHMVVLPDADIDLAADAAVNAGFGSAGERCMAIAVVVAVGDVGDELVPKITDRMAAIKVGDGRGDVDMGPLITRGHRERVLSYLDTGVDAGAKLVVDGREAAFAGDASGFWLGPTLFDHVAPDMDLYVDEIFGPVLSVVRVRDIRRRARAGEREPLRQRHRDLHQRRRRGTALPDRRGRRDGRHQRADSGAGRVLLVRRLEELVVRRRACVWSRRRPLLHSGESRHGPVARPEPRWPQPRFSAEHVAAEYNEGNGAWCFPSTMSRWSTPIHT